MTSTTTGLDVSHEPGLKNSTIVDSGIFWIIALVGVLSVATLLLVPHFFLPAEDAFILFQFSRNLAHTGAITFYAHGPHAEGATDFAWMVLIAGAMRLGIPPFWCVALINVASFVGLAFLLTKLAGLRLRLPGALFIIGAFALMPQITAAASGFSTLPFACLLVLIAYFFLEQEDAKLALVSLLLCLFRPDGVIFAIPMLIAALILFGNRGRRAALFAGLFVLPGLLYFFWRWRYFGLPLPLPFFVKSNTARLAHLFVKESIRTSLRLCLFSIPVSLLALRSWRQTRVPVRAVALCLLLLPNLFYFAMRLDQNVGLRFFIYLPVATAILIAVSLRGNPPYRPLLFRTALVLYLIMVAPLWLRAIGYFRSDQFMNRKAIAQALDKLPHGTLISTETGIVPFYSQWTTYDPWGLSTASFSRSLFQPSDVAKLHPDAMLVHTQDGLECESSPTWEVPYTTRTWGHLTRNIVSGAEAAKYELWYVPAGSSHLSAGTRLQPRQGHEECWFISRETPLRTGIEDILAQHGGVPASQFGAR